MFGLKNTLFVAIIVVLATILFSNSVSAQVFYFNNDLRLGDSNSEVLELQKFLNKDPDTRLASSGPGSPGQETTYFGPITHNAVIRFQEKYASEVLAPVGLTQGTGYFGPSSRAKVNEILEEDNFDNQINNQTNNNNEDTPIETQTEVSVNNVPSVEINYSNYDSLADEQQADNERAASLSELSSLIPNSTAANLVKSALGLNDSELALATISSYSTPAGEVVRIYGSGFNNSQEVFLGLEAIPSRSLSVNEFAIKIPSTTSTGLYPLYIRQITGLNQKYSETVDIYIGEETNDAPEITGVRMSNKRMIISGKNFGEVNSVSTTLGLFRNITSDDPTEIVIPSEYLNLSPYIRSLDSDEEKNMSFQVVSPTGLSNRYSVQDMKIDI